MSENNGRLKAGKEYDATSLNRFVSYSMQKAGVPGLSLTLTHNGEVVFSRGYGHRDIEERKPATEDTIYGIGSVTKSFTSMAIMQLSERGLIDINKPVREYLEDFHPDAASESTTISHLMSHSSGIPAINASEIMLFRETGSDTSYIPMTDFNDFMELMNASGSERHSPPGKRFFYWNEGYTMLGKIVEIVSGKPFSKYVHDNILTPLGMERAFFYEKEVMDDEDHATPYYRQRDGSNSPSRLSDEATGHAPGGLVTSSLELSKYLSLWTSERKDQKLLSEKGLHELIEPRIKTSFGSYFGPINYGYGWMVMSDFFGHTLIMHSGSVAASSGFVGFIPDLNVAVSIGANTSDAPNSKIGMYALSLLIEGASPQDLPFIKLSETREKLKGYYEDFRGYTRVNISDGQEGILNMQLESDEFHITLPIIIEKDQIYTISNDLKMELEVRMKNGRDVEIFFERHRFVKK